MQQRKPPKAPNIGKHTPAKPIVLRHGETYDSLTQGKSVAEIHLLLASRGKDRESNALDAIKREFAAYKALSAAMDEKARAELTKARNAITQAQQLRRRCKAMAQELRASLNSLGSDSCGAPKSKRSP